MHSEFEVLSRGGNHGSKVEGGEKTEAENGSPPAGSRGRAPVEGLGCEVPQKLKHLLLNIW